MFPGRAGDVRRARVSGQRRGASSLRRLRDGCRFITRGSSPLFSVSGQQVRTVTLTFPVVSIQQVRFEKCIFQRPEVSHLHYFCLFRVDAKQSQFREWTLVELTRIDGDLTQRGCFCGNRLNVFTVATDIRLFPPRVCYPLTPLCLSFEATKVLQICRFIHPNATPNKIQSLDVPTHSEGRDDTDVKPINNKLCLLLKEIHTGCKLQHLNWTVPTSHTKTKGGTAAQGRVEIHSKNGALSHTISRHPFVCSAAQEPRRLRKQPLGPNHPSARRVTGRYEEIRCSCSTR